MPKTRYRWRRSNVRSFCLLSLSFLLSSPVFALTDLNSVDSFLHSPVKGERHFVHHYQYHFLGDNNKARKPAFALSPSNIDEVSLQYLRLEGLSYLFQLKRENLIRKNLFARANYTFAINNIAVCDYQFIAVSQGGAGASFLGSYPQIDDSTYVPTISDWVDFDDAMNILAASENADIDTFKVRENSRCFFLDSGLLIPAWKINYARNGQAFLGYVGPTTVLRNHAYFLHGTTPVGSVYKINPAISGITEENLAPLDDSGFLNSAHILTDTAPNERAKESSRVFDFSKSDPRFDEVNVFYHVSEAYEWFKALGYVWHTKEPLTISLKVGHTDGDVETNNAYYQPFGAEKTNGPMIYVGPGDGYGLQNLTLDTDVVTHEFGHHIIFQTLKDTNNEDTVTIHEGLSDFFTFAKGGDSCLGDSICPQGSPYCSVVNKCLRSGNSTLTYKSSVYNGYSGRPHLKGQLLSGWLWDLVRTKKINADKLAKIAYRAISYLPESSFLNDFVFAILSADKELNNGENACSLIAAAKKRAMDPLVGDVDCNTLSGLSDLKSKDSADASVNTTSTQENVGSSSVSSGSKKSHSWCGVISRKSQDNESITRPPEGLNFAYLLSLPLLFVGLRALKRRYIDTMLKSD